MSVAPSTVVIGGGIVGICCALYLQREGMHVTLVDPAEPGDSTAKWSCGQMAVSEIIPLSKPGIIRKIPGWMLDQKGPLALRPAAVPQLATWMLRFMANARRSRIERIAQELASLTATAYEDYQPLLDNCEDKQLFGTTPTLEVFGDAAGLQEEQEYIALRRRLGYKVEPLGAQEIADLEPVLAGKFSHGLLLEDWRTVKDTQGFMVALTRSFLAQGGSRVQGKVQEIGARQGKAERVVLDNGESFPADHVVVAAGNGSKAFFKMLGVKVPLMAIGGYQVVVRDAGLDLRHATVYADGGFGFIPMSRGLQIGGTIEFAGDNAEPNHDRCAIILEKAKRLFPSMNTADVEFGTGWRPFLPDTKPVIDRSPALENVYMAFGHGQLGLTLGATTARLIADMVQGRQTALDLGPFRASRF
ncbi:MULTISPECIES: FAD-dependent oxidoreductase [unclassified Modicisalibacter]|uniref:NAD(P)/FAD-dependent oxidoreductase n=1 Tax=unclassified Modicisalibacter TaxID=2679913 RepID=UPI001CC9890C|nr:MULTISPECIES: FAD-dependent oxidoreductase [unclassified Modicisalibacter]MBZ9557943.1 FAD-dependent oxidoreductase [Modicisalibacter sp. R2A 31.J]MBZ9573389.1 FAD-dependent oxidoreductase [Modicisalibacter sp. MOD 31.J]